ncbi:MurR/RpiR family transcriptional regulator [Enterococcus hulanensis]|uniref:MurR/RpiR family transcriptional regulator n=1 Tax=Enterococcus hulanensis TaxID=2559929 RepID=UPI00288CE929|nr:MurR/RpiR family transcriptional regulator [Enterococcus hulanensis]MDT2658935.1 MurR/RpiR family transcriptional regulator [Enterococcus hulanensis]
MEFQQRVINQEYRFTDLEDEIVRYIGEHKLAVSKMKIVDLASKFFTAPNTITRMCHKLGYSGYSELKNELKHEINEPVENVHEQKELLLRNFDLIDSERERQVAQLFSGANRINFFAIGQTAYATKIVVDNFYAIEDKAFFYTYANELRHKIEHSTNEIFFFVSLSGEKDQILELAKLAKEHGHPIVSLTGLSVNSLAKLADISLFCYSPEVYRNHYNITDKTPILVIMNSLLEAYAEF